MILRVSLLEKHVIEEDLRVGSILEDSARVYGRVTKVGSQRRGWCRVWFDDADKGDDDAQRL